MLLFVLLFCCLNSSMAANPFVSSGKPQTNTTAVTQPVPQDRGWLMDILVRYQQALNSSISARLKHLKSSGSLSAFLFILLIAFVYGILHALSPGHGKVLFSGWVLNSRKKFSKIIFTSVAGTFAHTLSATLLVFGGWLILKQVVKTEGELRRWLNIIAGTTMVLIGLYTIVKFIRSKRQPGSHDHGKIRPGCIVFLMGAMPCPLSTMIMLFCLSLGLVWQGLVIVLFFSLGMAVTFLILGFLVWVFRERILAIEKSWLLWGVNNLLPLFVALFLCFYRNVAVYAMTHPRRGESKKAPANPALFLITGIPCRLLFRYWKPLRCCLLSSNCLEPAVPIAHCCHHERQYHLRG